MMELKLHSVGYKYTTETCSMKFLFEKTERKTKSSVEFEPPASLLPPLWFNSSLPLAAELPAVERHSAGVGPHSRSESCLRSEKRGFGTRQFAPP